MDIQTKDGILLRGIPDGTPDDVIKARIIKIRAESQIANDPITKGAQNFAQDMPGMEKFAAGYGKAGADLVRGVGQTLGIGPSFADTAETRKLDAPLMNSGAGFAGNITGNVVNLLPTAAIPGVNTIAGGAAVGTGIGLSQPATSLKEKGTNAGIGAISGAALPILSRVWNTGKSLLEPLYEGGREQIVGRTINKAAGDKAQQLAQALRGGNELVPGSVPTVAEVAQDANLSALQRSAAAINPQDYAQRGMEQASARVGALKDIAGSETDQSMSRALRDYMSGGYYQMARQEGIDPAAAKMMKPQIDNLMQRMPSGVVEKAKELARINGEAMGPEGSVNGLHYIKKAVDDLIDGAQSTGIGNQTKAALVKFKGDLLDTLNEISPKYMQGSRNFATFSKPINQQEVAGELVNKLQPALADYGAVPRETANTYANALRNGSATVKRVTGFNQPLEKVMDPAQMDTLNNIAKDLARKASAQDLGRGPGSDTVQKLAFSNMLNQAQIPNWARTVLQVPGSLAGKAGNMVYSDANQQLSQRLAQALLNPKDAADLMTKANPAERAAIVKALLAAPRPAIMGGAMALEQRQ